MPNTTVSRAPRILAAALAFAAGAGCGGDQGGTRPIEEKRVLAGPRPEQQVAADTRRRLGASGPGEGMPRAMQDGPPAGPSLAWDLPQGWKELPPAPLRNANFSVPGRDRLECYVTVLPGGGGGIPANVARWHKQMGLAAPSDADVAKLPRIKFLGAEGPFVRIDGTFKGAGAESGSAGYTMAATVVEFAGAAVTAKLVGPSADVAAEIDRFVALCGSMRDTGSAGLPAGHPPMDAPSGEFDPGALKWTTPAGWKEGPAKQMRLVTLVPADKTGVECYVTVLQGTGGGLEANVNRWRGQLGQTPLSAAEVAALTVVPVLGRDARFVEIEGGGSGLLGLVCELGAQTVFVKMTGPVEVLRAERERFLAFCKSLS